MQGLKGQVHLALLACPPRDAVLRLRPERRHEVHAGLGPGVRGGAGAGVAHAGAGEADVAVQVRGAARGAGAVQGLRAAARAPALGLRGGNLPRAALARRGPLPAAVAHLADADEVPHLVVEVEEGAVEELHLHVRAAAVSQVHVEGLRRHGVGAGVRPVGRPGHEVVEALLVRGGHEVQEPGALQRAGARGAALEQEVRELRRARGDPEVGAERHDGVAERGEEPQDRHLRLRRGFDLQDVPQGGTHYIVHAHEEDCDHDGVQYLLHHEEAEQSEEQRGWVGVHAVPP
mmetsp:Transcript_62568/g.201775  ORF Transcript_62568/g.201775 Transcript_62568/m.201775 type:complete len:289 (-) Transcript_62568:451-1317(-)